MGELGRWYLPKIILLGATHLLCAKPHTVAGSTPDGPRESWNCGGTYYYLYTANLHVHTEYSADKIARRAQTKRPGDHFLCTSPRKTVEETRKAGLDILGLSDHCFRIDPYEWGWSEIPDKNRFKPSDWWDSLRRGAEDGGNYPTCLVGFEWTPKHYDHINVFGLGKRLLTAQVSEHPYTDGIYDPALISDSAPGSNDGLRRLCDRLAALGVSSGSIVCQFNHPMTSDLKSGRLAFYDYDMRSSSRGGALPPEEQAIRDMFALIEVGSGSALAKNICNFSNGDCVYFQPFDKGERYWQRALARGWWCAPAAGVDNQLADLTEARERHTGVWIDHARLPSEHRKAQAAVLRALRARRVFASEHKHLSVWLEATTSRGENVPMGTRDVRVAPGEGLSFLAQARVPERFQIAKVQLVEVRSKNGEPEVRTLNNGIPADGGKMRFINCIPTFPETLCYYLRVEVVGDLDGDVGPASRDIFRAYSAPIWVEQGLQTVDPGVAGTATVLVLDVSASMSHPGKLEAAKAAALDLLSFVELQNRAGCQHKFSLVTFSTTVVDVLPLTEDLASIRGVIERLAPITMTDLVAPPREAYNILSSTSQMNRSIIFMTDGEDTVNGAAAENMLEILCSLNKPVAPIATVGFGSDADRALLQRIANLTNGQYYEAADAAELKNAYLRHIHHTTGQIIAQNSGTVTTGETIKVGSPYLRRTRLAGVQVKLPFREAPGVVLQLSGRTTLPMTGRQGTVHHYQVAVPPTHGPPADLLAATLTWEGGVVNLDVKDPSGRIIDATYLGAEVALAEESHMVVVAHPKEGRWSFYVRGVDCAASGSPYEFIASSRGLDVSNPRGSSGSAVMPRQSLSSVVPAVVIVLVILAAACAAAAIRAARPAGPASVLRRPCLVVSFGGRQRVFFPGQEPRWIIVGRSDEADMVVPHMSSRQLALFYDYGQRRWYARDLTRGDRTYHYEADVGSVSVWREGWLNPGDALRAGSTIIRPGVCKTVRTKG